MGWGCYGVVVKSMEVALFFYYLVVAIIVPIFDPQLVVAGAAAYYPKQLVKFAGWYVTEFEDYLVAEMPHFFTALLLLEVLVLWPLAIVNLYALVFRKSWFNTTCLLFGAFKISMMVAVMGELIGSGRASKMQMMAYSPFMGFAAISIFRGLIPFEEKPTAASFHKNKRKDA